MLHNCYAAVPARSIIVHSFRPAPLLCSEAAWVILKPEFENSAGGCYCTTITSPRSLRIPPDAEGFVREGKQRSIERLRLARRQVDVEGVEGNAEHGVIADQNDQLDRGLLAESGDHRLHGLLACRTVIDQFTGEPDG